MENTREAIFANLRSVAKSIVETFGRHCEVVIHDFEKLPNSLVFIEGDITTRKPGAPITDLVLRRLKREGNEIKDMFNYGTVARDGRRLKSSTIFVRDEAGQVIGAFCINFDITDYLNVSVLMDDFIRSNDSQEDDKSETFAVSFNETLDSFIEKSYGRFGKHPTSMNKDEKTRFVEDLDEQGAFLLKGAVEYVAKAIGVSKYTVYNYLKEIRSKDHNMIL